MTSSASPAVLGGKFGLPLEEGGEQPPFLGEELRSVFLANARSGIRLLVDQLRPAQVWLPSYLCSTIIWAAENGRTDVRFFPVSGDLRVEDYRWLDEVRSGDLVLFIDYFGFRCNTEVGIQARGHGAYTVEDASQALLTSGIDDLADFTVLSPRKFLGIPDGGVLRIHPRVELPVADLQSPPVSSWYPAFWAAILRREFDVSGNTRDWVGLFKEAEANQPIGAYAMTEFSKALLERAFDYSGMRKRRAENFRILSEGLCDIAMFHDLPEGVTPLGFPVRVERRDALLAALFQHEIYPPIHWNLENAVPLEFHESHLLSRRTMTLPCDQRYAASDMERMVECVRKAMVG